MRISAVGMGWCAGQRSSFSPSAPTFVGDAGEGNAASSRGAGLFAPKKLDTSFAPYPVLVPRKLGLDRFATGRRASRPGLELRPSPTKRGDLSDDDVSLSGDARL